MPAVIGAVNINSVSGTVNFGDALNLSPKSNTKEFLGSGSSNVGNMVNANNGFSIVNTIDPSIAENVQIGNI